MGYIRHHAIIVTGCIDDQVKHRTFSHVESLKTIEDAHKKATMIFDGVSPIIKSHMNGYKSFFIAPDGSKEGWEESNAGDQRRDEFMQWIRGDEMGCFSVAEVQYGDDAGINKVTRTEIN